MTPRVIVERAVAGWVHLYTFALPRAVASERTDELLSDLWEDFAAGGRPGSVLRRLVRGVPADVAWRVAKGVVAPWLRPALRLAAVALLLLSLASIQHATGRHTFIGNVMYVSWFLVALGAVGAGLVGAGRRYRR